jgi:hypothetical protein
MDGAKFSAQRKRSNNFLENIKELHMLRVMLLFTMICLSANLGHTAATDAKAEPKAYLPENVYQFQPAIEGTEVVHEFVLLNKGDAPLDIINVQSG